MIFDYIINSDSLNVHFDILIYDNQFINNEFFILTDLHLKTVAMTNSTGESIQLIIPIRRKGDLIIISSIALLNELKSKEFYILQLVSDNVINIELRHEIDLQLSYLDNDDDDLQHALSFDCDISASDLIKLINFNN
ncbi:hypothetical protein [uncultured Deefgea sp.]|uniref:hypothetical protein n=1 Tax=uncultured Deefgea sp. TaxID=1304914 RepID=UPI002613C492|nr:hypothetical protein [uncultured Deefgea sp.]